MCVHVIARVAVLTLSVRPTLEHAVHLHVRMNAPVIIVATVLARRIRPDMGR